MEKKEKGKKGKGKGKEKGGKGRKQEKKEKDGFWLTQENKQNLFEKKIIFFPHGE